MKNKLFVTAPSRSGSSLLVASLNCLRDVIIINEPINSVNISSFNNIERIFISINKDVDAGLIKQRIGLDGKEVTDTFPPTSIKWGCVNCDPQNLKTIGIKKSFPSFSNIDYFEPFLSVWKNFVKWLTKEKNGKVLAIVRDPFLTILSWKTTFDALKEETEKQCMAWNSILSTILDAREDIFVLKYEDFINNREKSILNIANYLKIDPKLERDLPKIKRYSEKEYCLKKGFTASEASRHKEVIRVLCKSISLRLGYP